MSYIVCDQNIVLDTTVSYKDALKRTLELLTAFKASLSGPQEAVERLNLDCTPARLNSYITWWENSINESLNGTNPRSTYVPMRKEGHIYYNDKGHTFVKGLVINNHVALLPTMNPIRAALVNHLQLPIWIKREIENPVIFESYDELDAYMSSNAL